MKIPCDSCTSVIYCEMNGCKRPRAAVESLAAPAGEPEQPQEQPYQAAGDAGRTDGSEGPPTRGLHALKYAVQMLRETGWYRDEEGEATNDLQDLIDALANHSGVASTQEPLGRCCYGGTKMKRDCASCAAWTPLSLAHSKSEYKRRVALGDPGVLPPVSAPEPAGEEKPVAWIEWNDAKNEASLGAEPTRDKETYELLPGFSFRPLYAAPASQRELLRECEETLWVCAEHDALHFGEAHNTVIQARATLAKLREYLKDDKAGGAGVDTVGGGQR